MISNVSILSKFLVFFFFILSLTLSAQIVENTPMPPAEAEPLITENWGAKRKTMKNFTLDPLRIESVNLIVAQKIPDVERFKFYKGSYNGEDIILTVGVDDNGNALGDYYLTSFSLRIGPCPDTCD